MGGFCYFSHINVDSVSFEEDTEIINVALYTIGLFMVNYRLAFIRFAKESFLWEVADPKQKPCGVLLNCLCRARNISVFWISAHIRPVRTGRKKPFGVVVRVTMRFSFRKNRSWRLFTIYANARCLITA